MADALVVLPTLKRVLKLDQKIDALVHKGGTTILIDTSISK
jgi:hypothetical protein